VSYPKNHKKNPIILKITMPTKTTVIKSIIFQIIGRFSCLANLCEISIIPNNQRASPITAPSVKDK
jgi:hypothetical protein